MRWRNRNAPTAAAVSCSGTQISETQVRLVAPARDVRTISRSAIAALEMASGRPARCAVANTAGTLSRLEMKRERWLRAAPCRKPMTAMTASIATQKTSMDSMVSKLWVSGTDRISSSRLNSMPKVQRTLTTPSPISSLIQPVGHEHDGFDRLPQQRVGVVHRGLRHGGQRPRRK